MFAIVFGNVVSWNWVSKLTFFVRPPRCNALGFPYQILQSGVENTPSQCYKKTKKPSAYRVNLGLRSLPNNLLALLQFN